MKTTVSATTVHTITDAHTTLSEVQAYLPTQAIIDNGDSLTIVWESNGELQRTRINHYSEFLPQCIAKMWRSEVEGGTTDPKTGKRFRVSWKELQTCKKILDSIPYSVDTLREHKVVYRKALQLRKHFIRSGASDTALEWLDAYTNAVQHRAARPLEYLNNRLHDLKDMFSYFFYYWYDWARMGLIDTINTVEDTEEKPQQPKGMKAVLVRIGNVFKQIAGLAV